MRPEKPILDVSHLCVLAGSTKILTNVNFSLQKGEIIAVMGQNGSGKSTLAHALMGNPSYSVTGKILFSGKNIVSLATEERASLGMFLGFQSPIAIPGVSVANILHEVLGSKNRSEKLNKTGISYSDIVRMASSLEITDSLLTRGIHDGFSGGERKKIEMLQAMLLRPKFAVFDEIDTGVDVDALRIISQSLLDLSTRGTSVMIISHNTRILRYLPINKVLVFSRGTIVKTGDASLIDAIETNGFVQFKAKQAHS